MTALRDALFTSSTATGLLARCRFPSGETLHCAVSGGADSLTLLLLACRTERKVTAWHVDHGLRSDSANDFAFVNDIAVRLGVEAALRTVRVEQGPNIEARARDARFAVLPPNVLTGHTADDQAETVIINLLRGSGTAGLSGMTREGHPLLGLRRHETRSLCDELGLTPLSDPMNEDDRFRRVRIRNEVLPLLGDVSKRDVVDVLVRQAELLRDDDDLLDELAAMIDVHDAKAVTQAPIALARRAIRQWLADPLPPCDIGDGRQVRRSRQRLRICTSDVM